jgi:electron transfer flavoprotein alpha subunit
VILVLIEPGELSLEALTLARALGGPVEAVAFGETPEGLGAYGVSCVHVVPLDEYAPGAWAQSIVRLVESLAPDAVLAAGSDRGQEVLAHAAVRLDAPMAANCVAAQPGDPWLVTRQRWGGSLLEEARLHGPVRLLTVAPHGLVAEPEAQGAEPEVVEVAPELKDDDFRVRVSRLEAPAAGTVQLGDARVVVGGGRGVGSAEGFAPLEELAGLLGGAVGGSRVVTNLGWRPHSDQIGQTGARIAPDLYIACGVSGAIQHMVGCKGAKRILAINKDPQAPIVARADYAVIGDLTEILPAVVAELKRT